MTCGYVLLLSLSRPLALSTPLVDIYIRLPLVICGTTNAFELLSFISLIFNNITNIDKGFPNEDKPKNYNDSYYHLNRHK